jgi:urocanate hydratase
MSKYTPGPWEALTRDEYNDLFQTDEESELLATYAIVSDMNDMYGPWTIAEIIGGLGEVQVNANARLIAAAPDLLEACEEASLDLRLLEGYVPSMDMIDAAIRKAKGETDDPQK